MASDEYQLMSRKELVELKDQLKRLKEVSASPDKNLQVVMSNMQKTMIEMIGIFREALENMKEDGSDQSISKKLEELSTKIDILIDQNEKLAEGIVTIADLIKENVSSSSSSKSESIAPAAPPVERFIPTQFPSSPPEQPPATPSFYPQPIPPPMTRGPAPTTPPMPSRPPQRRPFPNFL